MDWAARETTTTGARRTITHFKLWNSEAWKVFERLASCVSIASTIMSWVCAISEFQGSIVDWNLILLKRRYAIEQKKLSLSRIIIRSERQANFPFFFVQVDEGISLAIERVVIEKYRMTSSSINEKINIPSITRFGMQRAILRLFKCPGNTFILTLETSVADVEFVEEKISLR